MAVCSDEWAYHLDHIDKFLSTIKQSGLTLTLKKSEFAKSEVLFCGNIVVSGEDAWILISQQRLRR